VTIQQRFARLVTTAVVRVPVLWKVFRGPMRRNFDRLAGEWNATRVDERRLAAIDAALDAVPAPPATVLDLGTGTGAAARLAAARWPDAAVTGADVSPGMVAEARRHAASANERYEVADSAALPYPDGSFELVTLNNMIPFFDEVARVVAPGGHVAVAFALGPSTPIFVPLDRVRAELERRGLVHVADFSPGPGQSLLARKPARS
jgi:ubiquinone/menaquinone biosynthesis C-methylase UbiE